MFDAAGQATKFLFVGAANFSQFPYIPSDRAVLVGLSGRSAQGDFRRALGTPAAEEQQETAGARVFVEETGRSRPVLGVRVVWKVPGYVVDAKFVAEERGDRGNIYEKGTLGSFEIYRGL